MLYEPYSIAEQRKIMDMAYERWSDGDDSATIHQRFTWIGVTDKISEGQYTYNSNNQPINFTPDWNSDDGSGGRSRNCIMMFVNSPSGNYYSEWYDRYCTYTTRSICWSIN